MQKVSAQYKVSMKQPLRERGYIMLNFGLINQEAQANASAEEGLVTYFSNKSSLFQEADVSAEKPIYATLEEKFTSVDGSMYFLPRDVPGQGYFNTGIVSRELISNSPYTLIINLNTVSLDFKGLTLEFGDNYPTSFTVSTDSGQTETFSATGPIFTTETVFTQVTVITITVNQMLYPNNRFRIRYFLFGIGLSYRNEHVMSSSLDSYMSPIGADVPQIDFSVTLKNYDRYFDVDNPSSAVNFLEAGQEMDVWYGYDTLGDGKIEWVRGTHLLCAEWESTDSTATIRCRDMLRDMNGEYYRGVYSPNGTSFYDLALAVITEAQITDYYIDPYIKRLSTKNPIPRVGYKQALQLIANACRCTLSQTREGQIRIKSNFIPEYVMSCNGEEPYSKFQNIRNNSRKDEYGTLAQEYTTSDGEMFFLPEGNLGGLNTGYISSAISGEAGTFSVNPKITIVQEAASMYYGVRIIFGNALPAEIRFVTYNDGALVTDMTVTDGIVKNTVVQYEFDDFDTMEIEFVRTKYPYNRIVIDYLAFGDITDFTMQRIDMMSSPRAIKQELIKEVVVPCHMYQMGDVEDTLINQELEVVAGDEIQFFLGEPCYNYRIVMDTPRAEDYAILESGAYFVTVQIQVSGTFKFELHGYRYRIVERHAILPMNSRGTSLRWSNPLMSDIDQASLLMNWIGDYYRAGVEYEYSTRGNPELDAADIIYQENEFRPGMMVRAHRVNISFGQGFSGRVVARRVEA